ncbi:MAG: ParB/RepB/Spo0J family partition protein [Gammaproteobacteria bacterium]|nr:ParB/RepB/Spo0J family partition protein [Gammaproteobacteria bacterium]
MPDIKKDDFLKDIAVDQIIPGKYQPRSRRNLTEASLQELADSINSEGLIEPIVVRKHNALQYELIAGERRWRATQLAGLHYISAIVKDLSDEQAAIYSLVENIQRKALSPIEEARGFKRLIEEFKFNVTQVAQKVSQRRSSVSHLLGLLELHPNVIELIDERRLEIGHGKVLKGAQLKDQLYLSQRAVSGDWSVRKLTEELRQLSLRHPSDRYEKHPDIAHKEQQLSELLGCPVKINAAKQGEFNIVIKCFDQEIANGVIEHIEQACAKGNKNTAHNTTTPKKRPPEFVV